MEENQQQREESMTPTYLRALCAALGFTAVAVQGGKLPADEGARRAAQFANLIEEFCRHMVPEAFETHESLRVFDLVKVGSEGRFAVVERIADAIVDLYREQGGCLPQDLLARGFAREEIERHWAMAKALAQVAMNITDA
jgi:hypothetical protein